MRRKEPIIGTVFGPSDRNIQQAVWVEVFWVNLGAGHRRENLELITRETTVVAVARQPAADDLAILHRSDQLLFKRRNQFIRTAHPFDPRIRLDRHQSSNSLIQPKNLARG